MIDAEPVAQTVAGRIVEENSALVHPSARGLTGDQDPRARGDLQYWTWTEGQLAPRAAVNLGEEGGEIVAVVSLHARLLARRRDRQVLRTWIRPFILGWKAQ